MYLRLPLVGPFLDFHLFRIFVVLPSCSFLRSLSKLFRSVSSIIIFICRFPLIHAPIIISMFRWLEKVEKSRKRGDFSRFRSFYHPKHARRKWSSARARHANRDILTEHPRFVFLFARRTQSARLHNKAVCPSILAPLQKSTKFPFSGPYISLENAPRRSFCCPLVVFIFHKQFPFPTTRVCPFW